MMLREVNSSVTLESTVAAVPTVCVNIKSSITLNTQCIYVLHVTLETAVTISLKRIKRVFLVMDTGRN